MVDLFGKGPFVNDSPTGAIPPTYDRQQLFDAAVSELKATIAEGHLRPASRQEYGRLSLEAARMLLAKFYLNAEVYTGNPNVERMCRAMQGDREVDSSACSPPISIFSVRRTTAT